MTIGIIPARMASSRFPGKPLNLIQGVPMIGHCYRRSAMSKSLDRVYIATCDDKISQYAETIGAPCIMTADTHERASDRIAEAMLTIEVDTSERHNIVVLVQGDEPMLRPEMIDDAVTALEAHPRDPERIVVVNLMGQMESVEEFEDPNEVKVVVDSEGYAIYFSREPIPSLKKGAGDVPMLKQICIIPFYRDDLLAYNAIPQTPLEIAESVDMLRIIETGGKIKMVMCDQCTYAVDTLDDLKAVEDRMADDDLMKTYA